MDALEVNLVKFKKAAHSSLSINPNLAIPLTCAVFSFALHAHTIFLNGFVWDDRAALLNNPDAIGTRPIMGVFSHDFWGQNIAMADSHKSYRPLAVLSLRLNHSLHGLQPEGFHFVNVLLHSVVCALFSILADKVMRGHYDKVTNGHSGVSKHVVPSFLASALFAVHPIHTEPISCIVGRSDLLCGVFFLAAILCHLKSITHQTPNTKTNWVTFTCAAFFGLCAALSKELGVTVFGVFIAREILIAITTSSSHHFEQPASATSTCNSVYAALFNYFSFRTPILRTALCLAVPIAITCFHLALHTEHIMYAWTIMENDISLLPNFYHRLMSYMHVHALYFWKLCFPMFLCYDYGWPCIKPVVSIFDYRNIFGLAVYALVINFALLGASKRNSVYLWSGALTIVPFIPASNALFPVGTVLGERLLYLPSIGFCMGAASLFYDSISLWDSVSTFEDEFNLHDEEYFVVNKGKKNVSNTQQKEQKKKKEKEKKATNTKSIKNKGKGRGRNALYCLSAVAVVLSAKSVHRCIEWKDELSLFESSMNVCPTSLKALNNLANTLLMKETALRAGELLDTALDLHPKYPAALFNRGLVYFLLDDNVKAMHFFQRALALNPDEMKTRGYLAQVRLNVGIKLEREGKAEEAVEMNKSALLDAEQAIRGGCTLPMIFHVRCAAGHELNVDEAENVQYCARAIGENAIREARKDTTELISAELTYNVMGLILRNLGRHQESTDSFDAGLALNPDSFEILVNVGSSFTDLGDEEKSMQYYSRALKLKPESPELIANIGWLLELQGHLGEAKEHYGRALEIMKPYSHPQIVNNFRNIDVKILERERGRME